MNMRTVIFDQIRKVAIDQKKNLAPLSDDLPLLESGLDSLCVAILVANLQDELGVDPFGNEDLAAMPITLADFVRLYEQHAVT
jgi:acyl carrier protein